jgi:dephospho-CoA kinase
MPGSGKSEVARVFEANGYTKIRFGDLTDEEMKRKGLKPSEANERRVRESLRQEHGMAAYAQLSLIKIDEVSKHSDVVIDGLYSWEEYIFLKTYCGDKILIVAVWASPRIRYSRLVGRSVRRLTEEEAASRDRAEIENVNKGGPIAMAEITIMNEASVEELRKETRRIIAGLK